jgi:large subunit ribosomal protein L29
MTTAIELRDMDDAALNDHLQTARRELFGLRFQHATGELEDTSRLRLAKREVARTLTVVRERGIEADNKELSR